MNNDFDVNSRIKQLCEERSITYYELAKRSDIPYSTLSTMLHKSNQPSLITLRKICDGLGITLSHFFNTENEFVSLTDSQNECLSLFNLLSIEEQKLAIAYMKGMLHKLWLQEVGCCRPFYYAKRHLFWRQKQPVGGLAVSVKWQLKIHSFNIERVT